MAMNLPASPDVMRLGTAFSYDKIPLGINRLPDICCMENPVQYIYYLLERVRIISSCSYCYYYW